MSICNLRDELIVHELALVAITHLKAGKVGNICVRERVKGNLCYSEPKKEVTLLILGSTRTTAPLPPTYTHTRAAMKSSLLVNDDQPAQFL